jgi:hypothetical protein
MYFWIWLIIAVLVLLFFTGLLVGFGFILGMAIWAVLILVALIERKRFVI